MLDRLNLPASLRHLIEKRFGKQRRQGERRSSSEAGAGRGGLPTNADQSDRRSGAERRQRKRRVTD